MPEQRIDPVLVEKAVDVFRDIFYEEIPQDAIRPLDVAMQAAIRFVFDELGLKEERQPYHFGSGSPDHPWQTGCRLVSEWRSVEQGDTK